MPERFAITAGTIVPMNAPPIEDGAVIVSDGKIESVTKRAAVPADIPREEHPESILLPAFVNAHTHLAYTSFRGLADNADFFSWLTEHVIPLGILEREEEGRMSARLGVTECFRHGITAIGEQHYVPWGRDAMLEAGMKGVFFYEVFGIASLNLGRSVAEQREQIEKLVRESSDRVRTGVAPHAPYSVSPAMVAMALELAQKHGLPIATHVAETRDEVELFLRGEGRFATVRRSVTIPGLNCSLTPVEHFDKLGVLTPNTMIVHGVHVSDSDLDLISGRGCTMVTCPTSNAKLGVGIARVGSWMNRGIRTCIGTDSPASGETFDLFEEMRRFLLLQRGLTGETDRFPAATVLEMVTTNPARALGMQDMVGDLRSGSCADLLLVEPDLDERHRYRDVYETLLWDVTSQEIVKVWADGREVYRR